MPLFRNTNIFSRKLNFGVEANNIHPMSFVDGMNAEVVEIDILYGIHPRCWKMMVYAWDFVI